MTWSSRVKPVKFPLNQLRGRGVTILGAIGEYLPKAVFTLAPTTNREYVMEFFKKLRSVVTPNPMTPKNKQAKLVIVLDNHRAHASEEVTRLAGQLNMELMFLPPYCPELNSIESLWSQVKKSLKARLVESSYKTLTQSDFEKLMQESVDEVTPAQQKQAARFNNRDFIYRQISEYLNPEVSSEVDARTKIEQQMKRAKRAAQLEEEKSDSDLS